MCLIQEKRKLNLVDLITLLVVTFEEVNLSFVIIDPKLYIACFLKITQ